MQFENLSRLIQDTCLLLIQCMPNNHKRYPSACIYNRVYVIKL